MASRPRQYIDVKSMGTQLQIRKNEIVKPIAGNAAAVGLLCLPIIGSAYFGFFHLADGNGFGAGVWLVLCAVFIYQYTAMIIENCAAIYQTIQAEKRNYRAIDVFYENILGLLQVLPVRKKATIAMIKCNQGTYRMYQGLYESSEDLLRFAVERVKTGTYKRWPAMAISFNNLASVLGRQHKFIEAELELENSFDHLKRTNGIGSVFEAHTLLTRASVRLEQNENQSAIDDLTRAQMLFESAPRSAGFPERYSRGMAAHCKLLLALAYARVGDLNESKVHFRKIQLAIPSHESDMNVSSAHWLYLLSNEYLRHQMHEESEFLIRHAYALLRSVPYHPDAEPTLVCFRQLLEQTDRAAEVADMKAWLLPMDHSR